MIFCGCPLAASGCSARIWSTVLKWTRRFFCVGTVIKVPQQEPERRKEVRKVKEDERRENRNRERGREGGERETQKGIEGEQKAGEKDKE